MPSRGLSLFPHLFHTLCFSQELVSVLWFSTLLPCYENSPQCLITAFCSPAHTLLCMKHSAESVLVLISKFCIINSMRVFNSLKKKNCLRWTHVLFMLSPHLPSLASHYPCFYGFQFILLGHRAEVTKASHTQGKAWASLMSDMC